MSTSGDQDRGTDGGGSGGGAGDSDLNGASAGAPGGSGSGAPDDGSGTGGDGSGVPPHGAFANLPDGLDPNSSTLQGLLRRLGAGLDDLFPAAGSAASRLRQVLSAIRQPQDESSLMSALSQLCELLSVGSEDSMASFSIDAFASPLVSLMAQGASPEVMLLAARALTHMMDALPSSASAIAAAGAAAPLCGSLIAIEYMDLAEQSLAALEKLSADHPQPIVRAGGFAAVLSFIDFFSTGVQRSAAATAANLCRSPPSDAFDMIVAARPNLMALLDSPDSRIRESSMHGLARLADAFRREPSRLETLAGEDRELLQRTAALVTAVPPPRLGPAAYSAALRLLATTARGSASLSAALLGMVHLPTTISSILNDAGSPFALEALALADALLPDPQPSAASTTTTALPSLAVSRAAAAASAAAAAASAAVAAASMSSPASGGPRQAEGSSDAVDWDVLARSATVELAAARSRGAATRSAAVASNSGADGGSGRSSASAAGAAGSASTSAAAAGAAAAAGPGGPGPASGSLPGDGAGALVSSLRAMRRRRSSGSLPSSMMYGPGDPSGGAAAAPSAASTVMAERRAALEADEELLVPLGTALFECLMQFFVASSSSNARRLTLSTLDKFVQLASPSLLRSLALGVPDATGSSPSPAPSGGALVTPTAQLGPFVALLLRDGSLPSEVSTGLSLARSSLSKVPAMKTPFVREGVIHELRRLATATTGVGSSKLPPPSGISGRLMDRDASMRGMPLSYRSSIAASSYGPIPGSSGPSLSETAQSVLDTYFPSPKAGRGKAAKSQKGKAAAAATALIQAAEEDGLEFSVLTALSGLREQLTGLEENDEGVGPMVRLAGLLSSSDGITTFELSRSGLVPALVDFLECQSLPTGRARRTVAMVSALGRAGGSSFTALVSGTLGVLAAEDTLPLLVHDSGTGGGGSSSGGAISASSAVGNSLRQLTQPFKLRLRRAASSTSLRDYSHHVVLIEPLATMSSVQEFLWRRVRPAGAGGGPQDDAPGLAGDDVGDVDHDEEDPDDEVDDDEEVLEDHGLGNAIDDGEGSEDDVDDEGADESGGPDEDDGGEERGMFEMEEDDEDNSRLRRELGLDEDAMDEDDEDDEIEDDMDDGGGAAFGSADGLGTSLPPVELDLDAVRRSGEVSAAGADGASDGDAGAAAPRSSSFTRSYAAAVSRGSRGRRSGFDPTAASRDVDGRAMDSGAGAPLRLQFNLNGVDIPHDSSILQAVLRSSNSLVGGGTGNSGRRLWDNIHTLEYSAAVAAPSAAATAGMSSPAKRAAAASAGLSGSGSGDNFGERPEGRGARLTRSQKKQRGEEPAAGPSGSGRGGGSAAAVAADASTDTAEDKGSTTAPQSGRDAATDAQVGSGNPPVAEPTAGNEARSTPPPRNTTVVAGQPLYLDFEVPEQAVSAGLPASTAAAVKLLLYLHWVDANLRAKQNGPTTLAAPGISTLLSAAGPSPVGAVSDDAGCEIFMGTLVDAGAAVGEVRAVAAAVAASSKTRVVPLLPPASTPESYASARLDAKLMRQLSDPLALCGETIPTWCHVLARDSPFVLSFESRRELFYSTALGVTRALHRLQTRADSQSASGTGSSGGHSFRGSISEARIGRIQRQKVRIRRTRLLESAVKVMQLYSSHKTVLEVEYFDEVGTGLGPTLEFYTLASRELQRSSYKLWRSEHSEVALNKPAGGSSDAKPPPSGGRVPGKGKGKRRSGGVGGGGGGRRGAPGRSPAHPGITVLPAGGDGSDTAPDATCPVADEASPFVVPTGQGLFPSPMSPTTTGLEQRRCLELFRFGGRLVGKALSDGRLLDLRLSPVFCALLRTEAAAMVAARERAAAKNVKRALSGSPAAAAPGAAGSALSDADGISVDGVDTATDAPAADVPAVSDQLPPDATPEVPPAGDAPPDAVLALPLQQALDPLGLKTLALVDAQLAKSMQQVVDMLGSGDGDTIQSLCLSFTVPGNDDLELVDAGVTVEVTAANALQYVCSVVRYVLVTGVQRQVQSFLGGYSEVLDVASLLLFEPTEMELLMCGPSFEPWDREFLVRATRCDHGFSHESEAVGYLLRFLSELGGEDQRRFLLFATGSPALPVGGLLGLHPRLTIVKRTADGGRSADECLPTVSTCSSYLKLPQYSSYEILKERMQYAMLEGQGSFLLS